MTLDSKKILFISMIIAGYCLFFIEYKKIEILEKGINNIFYNFGNNFYKILPEVQNESIIIEDNSQNENKYDKIEIIVSKGDTFFTILEKFDFSEKKIFNIINEIEKYLDLRNLKISEKIIFYKDTSNEIKKIHLNLSIDTLLIVNLNEKIKVERKKLKKNLLSESKEFKIINSLYTDGIKNNLPKDILIKLIKLFSFDLDFQRDIRKNTKVSVSYDFNQIEGNNEIEYIDINYAQIIIEGKEIEYFKFKTDDDYIDYFNREGKNVKKSILKTPLDGARISSNFGMRKHPISGFNKMHKGVDFAAPKGTPIYAGGNGVIEYLGRNGGYGKYIRIRHNNNYKTAYAHLSAYGKNISKGVRVNQGDIIGFVGSTGNSTGPHLHYEILYQNKQINPLKLKLPSGKILEGKELERFKKEYKLIYANHLNLLYE